MHHLVRWVKSKTILKSYFPSYCPENTTLGNGNTLIKPMSKESGGQKVPTGTWHIAHGWETLPTHSRCLIKKSEEHTACDGPSTQGPPRDTEGPQALSNFSSVFGGTWCIRRKLDLELKAMVHTSQPQDEPHTHPTPHLRQRTESIYKMANDLNWKWTSLWGSQSDLWEVRKTNRTYHMDYPVYSCYDRCDSDSPNFTGSRTHRP